MGRLALVKFPSSSSRPPNRRGRGGTQGRGRGRGRNGPNEKEDPMDFSEEEEDRESNPGSGLRKRPGATGAGGEGADHSNATNRVALPITLLESGTKNALEVSLTKVQEKKRQKKGEGVETAKKNLVVAASSLEEGRRAQLRS